MTEITKEHLDARIAELTGMKDQSLAQANAAQGALVELQRWLGHLAVEAAETPVRAPVKRRGPNKKRRGGYEVLDPNRSSDVFTAAEMSPTYTNGPGAE